MFKPFLLFSVLLVLPLACFAQVNISPMVMPRKQFLGANGQPLANGHVCTYETGTTTPKATFTDYTGGTSNAVCDPVPVPPIGGIVLDAGGYAHIWVNCTSTPYRIVLYDANGVLQWSEDGVQYPTCIQPITCPAGQFLSALDTCGTPSAVASVRWNHILDPDSAAALNLNMSAGGSPQSSTWNNSGYFNFISTSTAGQPAMRVTNVQDYSGNQTGLSAYVEADSTVGAVGDLHGLETQVGNLSPTYATNNLVGVNVSANFVGAGDPYHGTSNAGAAKANFGLNITDQTGLAYVADGQNIRKNYSLNIDGSFGTHNTLGDGYAIQVSTGGGQVWFGNRTTSVANPASVQDPVFSSPFSATILDDMLAGGTYTGLTDLLYCVKIDGVANPNTFSWGTVGPDTSVNCTNGATGVAIDLSAQALSNGVDVTFAATTGHTLNSSWKFWGFSPIGFVVKSPSAAARVLQVNGSGKIITYNGIATVSGGVPSEVATVDLTAQTAAVGTTTLYAVPASGAGQYRLVWNAKVTTPATTGGTSSTLGALTIVYTDPDGVAQTITAGALTSAGAVATTSTTNTTRQS